MLSFELEQSLQQQGFQAICGIDEAGRGPLAGPVVAACVILPMGLQLEGLNDSKKISAKKRDQLFDLICESAICYSIASANEQEIDELNILNATFLAMQRALAGMKLPPDYALVDGNRDPHLGIPTDCVIKGDGKSPSIAAASILAKVTRDRYMEHLAEEYPQYQLAKHKGYPTQLHYDMIREHGVAPIHRRSFLKNLDQHIGKEHE